jgi:hypothetical protein
MLMALIHKKLSWHQENMEDILTSNVFGMLRYLPPQKVLFPFLAQAAPIDDERNHPLRELRNLGLEAQVSFSFWPGLEEERCEFAEPDVLLEVRRCQPMHATGRHRPSHLILIEAKYHAGTPRGQLPKEWRNLESLPKEKGAQSWLVYLTADFGCPSEWVKECFATAVPKGVLWLSWRHLRSVLKDRMGKDRMGKGERLIRDDLAEMLSWMNLTFYEGISAPNYEPPLGWSFNAAVRD